MGVILGILASFAASALSSGGEAGKGAGGGGGGGLTTSITPVGDGRFKVTPSYTPPSPQMAPQPQLGMSMPSPIQASVSRVSGLSPQGPQNSSLQASTIPGMALQMPSLPAPNSTAPAQLNIPMASGEYPRISREVFSDISSNPPLVADTGAVAGGSGTGIGAPYQTGGPASLSDRISASQARLAELQAERELALGKADVARADLADLRAGKGAQQQVPNVQQPQDQPLRLNDLLGGKDASWPVKAIYLTDIISKAVGATSGVPLGVADLQERQAQAEAKKQRDLENAVQSMKYVTLATKYATQTQAKVYAAPESAQESIIEESVRNWMDYLQMGENEVIERDDPRVTMVEDAIREPGPPMGGMEQTEFWQNPDPRLERVKAVYRSGDLRKLPEALADKDVQAAFNEVREQKWIDAGGPEILRQKVDLMKQTGMKDADITPQSIRQLQKQFPLELQAHPDDWSIVAKNPALARSVGVVPAKEEELRAQKTVEQEFASGTPRTVVAPGMPPRITTDGKTVVINGKRVPIESIPGAQVVSAKAGTGSGKTDVDSRRALVDRFADKLDLESAEEFIRTGKYSSLKFKDDPKKTAADGEVQKTLVENMGNIAQVMNLIDRAESLTPGAFGVFGEKAQSAGGYVGQLPVEDADRIAEVVTTKITGGTGQVELTAYRQEAQAVSAAAVPMMTRENSGRISDIELAIAKKAVRAVNEATNKVQAMAGLQTLKRLMVLSDERVRALKGKPLHVKTSTKTEIAQSLQYLVEELKFSPEDAQSIVVQRKRERELNEANIPWARPQAESAGQ